MTTGQDNYAVMVDVATGVMDRNNAKWNADTKISAVVVDVKLKRKTIDELAGIQGTSAAGATMSKNTFWQVAAAKTEHICSGLKSYYDDTDDETSYAVIDFNNTDFEYGKGMEVVKRMQIIQDVAALIPIASLLPFKILATEITDHQIAINEFKGSIPKGKILKTEKKAATKQLRVCFTLLRKQMKKLDNLMGTRKVGEPTFFDAYTNGRKIFNSGKGHITEHLDLMPEQFESIMGKKIENGDTLTIRVYGAYGASIGLTDTPSVLPTTGMKIIDGDTELKLKVPDDFGGKFGHWLVINNHNLLDDVSVTVLLAKGN